MGFKGRLIGWMAFLALTQVLGACSLPEETSTNAVTSLSQARPTATPSGAALPTATSPSLPAMSPVSLPTPTPTLSPQALAARLRLTMPIPGAHVPEWLDLLPGALRGYRSDIHEGVDFGFDAVGVPVGVGARVVAAGEGVVVRADLDYREPPAQEMEEILARSLAMGYTAAADLDKLRGRQVWIDHGDGVVTRYAHLDGVAPGVRPGVRVSKGQLIAYVGKSGVPGEGASPEPHLHFEIRLGDGYLGQGLPPAKARQLYLQALAGQD